jgi:hypothetical protein
MRVSDFTMCESKVCEAAATGTLVDLREIESAASKIKVQGARYPENMERMTGAERNNCVLWGHSVLDEAWHACKADAGNEQFLRVGLQHHDLACCRLVDHHICGGVSIPPPGREHASLLGPRKLGLFFKGRSSCGRYETCQTDNKKTRMPALPGFQTTHNRRFYD